jgi:two-component system, response regulator
MKLGAEILLVDDNPADVELTVHELHRSKLASQIHIVEDGPDALEFIFCRGRYMARSFAQPPSVILLDLKLPKIHGLEVLRTVRADERTRPIPVVILTSSAEHRDLTEAYRLGVNAYVQKPVDFAAFRSVIGHLASFWLGVNHPPPSEVFEPAR